MLTRIPLLVTFASFLLLSAAPFLGAQMTQNVPTGYSTSASTTINITRCTINLVQVGSGMVNVSGWANGLRQAYSSDRGGTSGTFQCNSQILLVAVPAIGYNFSGWTCKGNGCYAGSSQNITMQIGPNQTEYATFTLKSMTTSSVSTTVSTSSAPTTTISNNASPKPSQSLWDSIESFFSKLFKGL
jgi:uncharacterized repeat protein (TIGR02543 family)